MNDKPIEKKPSVPWGLIAVMAVLACFVVYMVVTVLSDNGPQKKSSFTNVILIKPPPVKEILPKPEMIKEVPQKEEIFTPEQNEIKNQSGEQDNTPAGDQLGLDADGTAGSDGFGLVGKKGGRSLLAGGGEKYSLLSKYAWYTQIVETEVRKAVRKHLEESGGIPRGKLQTIVQVSVDTRGNVVQARVSGSSGNHRMDESVKTCLEGMKISESPPDEMPRTMIIRVNSQS